MVFTPVKYIPSQRYDAHVLMMTILHEHFNYLEVVRSLENHIVQDDQMTLFRRKQVIFEWIGESIHKCHIFIQFLQMFLQGLRGRINPHIIQYNIHNVLRVFQNIWQKRFSHICWVPPPNMKRGAKARIKVSHTSTLSIKFSRLTVNCNNCMGQYPSAGAKFLKCC